MKRVFLLTLALAGAVSAGAQNMPVRDMPVSWINIVNARPTVAGNGLWKNVAGDAWSSGASSSKMIAFGDGAVRFTAEGDWTFRAAGLGHCDRDQSLEDIEFGWFLTPEGWAYPVESGVIAIWPAVSYGWGTVFEVAIRNGVVEFGVDGRPLARAVRAPMYPLAFDAALYTSGSVVGDAWITGFLSKAPVGQCKE
jgi:hypothetical protein